MIKNPKKKSYTSDRPTYLYDRVRQDIFEECHSKEATIIPSITTIFLLQLQASIIKVVTMLPPKRARETESLFQAYAPSCLIRQSMRWLLLVGLLFLDSVARLLNVQDEMNQLSRTSTKKKNQQEHEQGDNDDENETFFGSSTTASSISSSSSSSSHKKRNMLLKQSYNNGSSGATTPTLLTRCSRPCCTTPDPQTIYPSPPPSSLLLPSSSFHSPVRRVREKCISFPTTTTLSKQQQQQISHEKSSAICKSTQQTDRHTRSISTNSIQCLSKRKSSSPNSSLRRASPPMIHQPRHTVLKETTAWSNKKHTHPYHSTTSSIVTSSSGSSCESVRHNMRNTRPSSTEHQRKEVIQKPYERCCQACLSSQHN